MEAKRDGPRNPSKAPGTSAKTKKEVVRDKLPANDPDLEAEEMAAFRRRHAADLEEESRQHVSSEQNADLKRTEEDEERSNRRKNRENDERKRRARAIYEDDEAEDSESAAEEAKAKQWVSGGRTMPSTELSVDRMGDRTLTDPNSMQRALGSTARFAQHAMILAEDKMSEGIGRPDAVSFLAGLYLGLDDRNYAQQALKAFGPGTGILDIYPLEVVHHLLEHVPSFFDKARSEALFGGPLKIRARPNACIHLEFDANLKIRGFALEKGPRPGYRFEPGEQPGRYELRISTEGTYNALLSAISKDGWLLLDELHLEIRADAPATPEKSASEAAQPSLNLPPSPAPKKPQATQPKLPTGMSGLNFPRRI